MSFKGVKEGDWVFEAGVRYVKVIGGPSGNESLIVGMRNGQVVKVVMGNWFPISLVRHGATAGTSLGTSGGPGASGTPNVASIGTPLVAPSGPSVGIRCLDLNASRTLLALVDDRCLLAVYDLASQSIVKECYFQESGVSSCAWNTQFDNMLGLLPSPF